MYSLTIKAIGKQLIKSYYFIGTGFKVIKIKGVIGFMIKGVNPSIKKAEDRDIAQYRDVIELVNDMIPGNYLATSEHKRAIATELLRRLLIYKELKPEQFQQ